MNLTSRHQCSALPLRCNRERSRHVPARAVAVACTVSMGANQCSSHQAHARTHRSHLTGALMMEGRMLHGDRSSRLACHAALGYTANSSSSNSRSRSSSSSGHCANLCILCNSRKMVSRRSYGRSRISGSDMDNGMVCHAKTLPSQPPPPTPPPPPSARLHVPYGVDLASYPSMKGRTVLITGAARGLGFCTARLLAHLGANLYLADVDSGALAAAVEKIERDIPGAYCVVACPQLDLGTQDSVNAFVDWWLQKGLPLHVLVNNAGANFMGIEPWFTAQGVAGLPQVNFLGPYTLTRRLSSCLEASASSMGRPSRIVNVCSVMHRFSRLPENPQFFLKDWWTGGSYRNCKLALTMTTALLQRQLGPRGVDCVSVDPGAVYSNIWATSKILGKPPGSTVIRALFSTPEDACATMFHAAAAPTIAPGGYYARGLFADDAIIKSMYEPWAGVLSCCDWPLRQISSGSWAAEVRAVEVADYATKLGPAEAIWDACADLAGLPRGFDS